MRTALLAILSAALCCAQATINGVPSQAVSGFLSNASLGTGYLSTSKTAGAAGTTANTLCKIDSTGNVVTAATSDVSVLGVCITTQTSGQSVEVATRGIVNCVADNTTVIGNVAIVGTVTGGRCADSGQANGTLISPVTQIIGKILTVASAGSSVSIQLYGPGHYGANSSRTAGTPSDLTGISAAQTTQVSLASGLTAGHYVLNFDIVQNALASSGSCTYTFTFTYTNEVATETFTATGVALGATHSNSTNGVRPMNIGGAGTVSYVSALASGTCNGATYNPHIWVQLQ